MKRNDYMPSTTRRLVMLATVVLVQACGGGGDSAPSSDTTATLSNPQTDSTPAAPVETKTSTNK